MHGRVFFGDITIRQLFRTDAPFGAKTLIFAALAVLCLWLDSHTHWFQRIRNGGDVVVAPVFYTVSAPIRLIENAAAEFTGRQTLLTENTRLQAENTLLQGRLQKLLALEQENKQLQRLLQSGKAAAYRMIPAQLLAVSPAPALQQFVLNKGTGDGAFVGQAVIDAYGIVGQLVRVSRFTSRVMLVTSTKSAIPVQDKRSGVRAIAKGDGAARLILSGITDTADIRVGDVFISSGLGKRFGYGYPVGTVEKINRGGSEFAEIILTPDAHLQRSRIMLLIVPASQQARSTAPDDAQVDTTRQAPTATSAPQQTTPTDSAPAPTTQAPETKPATPSADITAIDPPEQKRAAS